MAAAASSTLKDLLFQGVGVAGIALAKIDPAAAVPALVLALDTARTNPMSSLPFQIIEALGSCGPRTAAVRALKAVRLFTSDERMRDEALKALVRIAPEAKTWSAGDPCRANLSD